MSKTENRNPGSQRPWMPGVVRWLVAGGVGAAVTSSLFIAMAAAIDGVDIVERMFRIFPLKQMEIPATDECAAGGTPSHLAVAIEGMVGRMRSGELLPLPDAIVVGENSITGAMSVEVSSGGAFQFVAAFPNQDPSACDANSVPNDANSVPNDANSVPNDANSVPEEGAAQQLVVRAPGCSERIVPITAAWVPHTVLLDCAARD